MFNKDLKKKDDALKVSIYKDDHPLKIKNNIIQRDFESYVQTIQKQIKISQEKDILYKNSLKKKVKKIDNFKKFQFETECELKLQSLRHLLKFSDPHKFENSNHYQKLANTIKKDLFDKFNLPNNLMELYGLEPKKDLIQEVYEENSADRFESPSSFISTSASSISTTLSNKSKSCSSINSRSSRQSSAIFKKIKPLNLDLNSTNEFIDLNQKFVNSQRFSLVLSGRLDKYYIYKFNNDGMFDKSTRQPIVKPVPLDFDYKKKKLEELRKSMYAKEKTIMQENNIKIQKFISEENL